MNIQVKTITAPAIITTSLGRYYATYEHGPNGELMADTEYMATPAASLREGVYAPLAVTDFMGVEHIIEQRATVIVVQVEEPSQ